MIKISKKNYLMLRHLSGKPSYLEILKFCYDRKLEFNITHKQIGEHLGKSSQNTSYHLRSCLNHGVLDRITSKETSQVMGYKISLLGIKFYKMYKTIEDAV